MHVAILVFVQAVKFEEEIGSPSKVISLEANEEVLKGRLKERGNFDDRLVDN